MSRTLAMVVAHPDDDTFGVAGTVALHADDPRFRFVLIHATDGEAGRIHPASGATTENLGAVRREEDRRGWRTLGREPDRHEWLGFPDGGLTDVPYETLLTRVAAILGEERPDVVLTFGPDGITGHPDHITIGRAATDAFHRFLGDGGPGFRRLLYGAIRESIVERWNELRVAQGLEPWDPTKVYHLRGVPDDQFDILVDTSSVAPKVRAALLEHRTQWDDVNDASLTPDEHLKAVSMEAAIIAWPKERPGKILTDLFEGL
ncbi:MAG TPA: PIG-L family deacetylase [Jiangellaceae bacterium]